MKRWLSGLLALCLLLGLLPAMSLRIFAVEDMTVSDQLVDVIKKMEGFAEKPFWDNSQYTVGYGTRCPEDMRKEWTERGITVEEAEALLHEELTSFEEEINRFAKRHGLIFQQHQFDALVSFSYNVGGSWTYSTNGYINRAVRSGDMGNMLIYAMCLYSRSGGSYILMKRRLAEANMYINGEYKAYNYDSPAYPDSYRYVYLDGNGATVEYAIHGYDGAANAPVVTSFTDIPVGLDAEGNPFVYEFAGWFTEPVGGEQILTLDGSLARGTIIYAQWKDPAGQTVALSRGDAIEPLQITTTGKIKLRTGPATFYPEQETVEKGTSMTIVETYLNGSTVWGKTPEGLWFSLAYTDYKDVLAALEQEKSWPRAGTVNANGVNVRIGPGTTYEVQYQAYRGDRVLISESYDDGSLRWGKLEDGNWICLDYVTFDALPGEEEPTVTAVELIREPDRKKYVQMQDSPDISGGVLRITYNDGTVCAQSVMVSMISDFSNAQLGPATVTLEHEGFAVTYQVEIIPATVTFYNYDGTVLSSAQYAYGETVLEPEKPAKPSDEAGEYVFIGWDKEVVPCAGDAEYTAVFELKAAKYTVTFQNYDGTVICSELYAYGDPVLPPEAPARPSDEKFDYVFAGWDSEVTPCDGDKIYTAVYEAVKRQYTVTFQNYDGTVLRSGLYAYGDPVSPPETPVKPSDEKFDYVFAGWDSEVTPCDGDKVYTAVYEPTPRYILGDFDGNETVNEDDAIYLLRHVVFPEKYPIMQSGDINGDGTVDEEDAIYLLRHVVFPDKYPLAADGQ